jgi:hypothetical protein
MPIFPNAPGIMDGWWCARHRTGMNLCFPNQLLSTIGTRHRYAADHLSGGPGQFPVTAPTTQLAGVFGIDASHRAKDNRTHRTHWPAAYSLDFLRVRCGCASVKPSVRSVIPGLGPDAPRVRTEDEL